MTNLLWLYILGSRFDRILESGLVDFEVIDSERLIPWYSRDTFWDAAADHVLAEDPATKFYRSNRQEVADKYGRLGRIGVTSDKVPLNQQEILRHIGHRADEDTYPVFDAESHSAFMSIFNIAGRGEWRFSSESLPRTRWEAVQIWQQCTWVNVPFDQATPLNQI